MTPAYASRKEQSYTFLETWAEPNVSKWKVGHLVISTISSLLSRYSVAEQMGTQVLHSAGGGPQNSECCPTLVENNLCHIHRSGRVTGTLMYEETKPTLRNLTMQSQATFVFRWCLRGRTEFGVKPGKVTASEAQIIWLETSHYGPDGNSTSLVPTNAQNLLWLWPSAPGVLRGPGWHYMAGLGEIPWVPQIVLALGKTVAVWMAHGGRVLYSRHWCPAEETNWSELLQRLRDAGPWSSAYFHLWGVPRNVLPFWDPSKEYINPNSPVWPECF